MVTTFASRTLSVRIDCPPSLVYDFVADPRHLPTWATGLCTSINKVGDDWITETLQGPVTIRFVERNAFGVVDHYVSPVPGVEVYVPMRVLANGTGSEVLLTLFRLAEMSETQYAEDAMLVERDLYTLKRVLEG